MTNVRLIPYVCGAGAKTHGYRLGPQLLKDWGLAEKLSGAGVAAQWGKFFDHPSYDIIFGTELDSPESLRIVKEYCAQLCDDVIAAVKEDYFPVTLGGDHSIAIGSVTGLAMAKQSQEKTGLLWIDAHLDSHTPETSPSGGLHGMPVAHLLGHGHHELTHLSGDAPILSPEHVCIIGARSFEEGEVSFLEQQGVRVFYMNEILERGLDVVLKEASDIVMNGTTAHFLSVDIDAFDPEIAPSIGFSFGDPENRGFNEAEKLQIFETLKETVQWDAIEIAEYNPAGGQMDGRTRDFILYILTTLLD